MSVSLSRMALVGLLGCWPSLLVAGERSYTYYDLFYPACPQVPVTTPKDINDSGVITGFYKPAGCGQIHGLVWFNGVMEDLDDTYEGGVFEAGIGISGSGVIIAEGDPDDVLALRDGMATPQPVPPGCEENDRPQAINQAGTMAVGSCDRNGSGLSVPSVYWIDEGISLALDLLPGLPDDATGLARDVNDAGVVIGIVDGEQRSFIWQDGVMTEIFNGLGGQGVVVNAINNHGLIVGLAGMADDFPAMSYDMYTEVMTVLGGGAAKAVNDRGVAVGDKVIDFMPSTPFSTKTARRSTCTSSFRRSSSTPTLRPSTITGGLLATPTIPRTAHTVSCWSPSTTRATTTATPTWTIRTSSTSSAASRLNPIPTARCTSAAASSTSTTTSTWIWTTTPPSNPPSPAPPPPTSTPTAPDNRSASSTG
ncbi:MAG: hypothetical protein IID37_04030 [Planctomycetes bacterium]|nr:hypothetical protein [Planctomycetota bacterium]